MSTHNLVAEKGNGKKGISVITKKNENNKKKGSSIWNHHEAGPHKCQIEH